MLLLKIKLLKKAIELVKRIIGLKKELGQKVGQKIRQEKIPLRRLARTMATFEGWDKKNSLARRNNNPLNLRRSIYQAGKRNGFAYFDSEELGWKAGIFDLACKVRGKTTTGLTAESTIRELIYKFAPPIENNTEEYLMFVCDELRINDGFQLKHFGG